MATRRARLQIKPNLGSKDPTKQGNKGISSIVKVVNTDCSTHDGVGNDPKNAQDDCSTHDGVGNDPKNAQEDCSTYDGVGNDPKNAQDTQDNSVLDSQSQNFVESEKTISSERNESKETATPEDIPDGCVVKTRSLDSGAEHTPPLANCSDSSSEEPNCSISESKKETATDKIKDRNEHSKFENSKTDTNGSGIVVRARFRRFGKVNIPSLKSNSHESKTFEKSNDQVPVDKNKNPGTPEVLISSPVQTSPLSIPQLNMTEVSNSVPQLNVTEVSNSIPQLNVTEVSNSIPQLNTTEVSNRTADKVNVNDIQKEIDQNFIPHFFKDSFQSQVQNTDTVNSSKIGLEEVIIQSDQHDISQENETENLTKIIDKSASEIILEKPNEVRPEPESQISAGVTMQGSPKVSVVNARPRIRLPKVQPNLADAGRRLKKNLVVDTTAEPEEGSILEASTTFLSAKEMEKEPEPSSESQTVTPTSAPVHPVPQTMTPTPVPLQLMSPVNRSPVKQWTPVLNQSPVKNSVDKRTRNVSTSEPRPKKKKQSVVIAPTDQPPDRTKMRMKDMIYWNPSSNPMKSKEKAIAEVKGKENKKENKLSKSVEEEEVGIEEALMDEECSGSNALPVPQVTVGPDGSIIINEQSLIVDQKNQLPREEQEVIDETDVFTTYHSYRKQNRSKSWSAKETAKFYKALGLVGIDFFLIGKLFPKRKHFELKKKFLKEERTNKPLIDKVLKEGGRFNMAVFEQLDAEDKDDEKKKNQMKEKKEISKERKLKKPEKQKEEKKSKRNPKPKRNRFKNINYFEGSDSEIEEARTARNKSQKKATKISNVDGEVLEILMTMREERIHTSEKETVVSPQPKVIVEPSKGPSTIFFMNSGQEDMPNPIVSQQGQNLTNNRYDSNSQSETNQVRFVTISPETGEPIVLDPKPQMYHQETYLVNSPNTGEGVTAGNSGQGTAQQGTPDRNYTTSQGLPHIVTTSMPGNGPNIQLPLEMFNIQNGDDQFILVTVMPENNEPGETVIHVYKLHGGNNVPQVPIQNL